MPNRKGDGMVQKEASRTRYEELPELLSPEEFSAAARLGRSVVYAGVKSGQIAARRFGRLIRIPRTELQVREAGR